MLSAGVPAFPVGMVMMIAPGVGIVLELPPQEGFHRLIRAAGNPGVQLNSHLRQGVLRPGPDSAAEKHIHLRVLQKPGQGPVAAAVGARRPGSGDRLVRHIVKLKLLRVAKRLETIPSS